MAFALTCEGCRSLTSRGGEGHFCQEAEHSQERGRRKLWVNYGGMFRGRRPGRPSGLSYGGLECQARENSGWISGQWEAIESRTLLQVVGRRDSKSRWEAVLQVARDGHLGWDSGADPGQVGGRKTFRVSSRSVGSFCLSWVKSDTRLSERL